MSNEQNKPVELTEKELAGIVGGGFIPPDPSPKEGRAAGEAAEFAAIEAQYYKNHGLKGPLYEG